MALYDLHSKMNKFYDDHVRLPKVRRDELAGYRDSNTTRLKSGLKKNGHPEPGSWQNQGSYAMHTLNQKSDNDYDIDVAYIFDDGDLPSKPAEARSRIATAMADAKFAKQPEALTNAVRVWYQEGHHVDLALYRKKVDDEGNETLEHAGSEWRVADPEATTKWFANAVSTKSPTNKTVKADQLRRIVRLLKMFAASRASWKLPGGMIVSALSIECYKPNDSRDDLSLYNTMVAIRDRLATNKEVDSPVGTGKLTSKHEYQCQVSRLYDRLSEAINNLAPLLDSGCTEKTAMKGWYAVYNHTYWKPDDSGDDNSESKKSSMSIGVIRNAPASIEDTGSYGARFLGQSEGSGT